MATLVLSTVGTLVGGPLGGALGALLGRTIDQTVLFRPKDREGPRLADLAVQSSQYGSPFAHVHGRVRLAGTVIWATDLKERRIREGGGKGRPGTTRYSYSASFAVALSARPISGVGRIWAEGNLLRGLDGVFTSETGFRLHTGHGDQPVDSLIAAAEGAGQCPAYRGLAYAVFEDMALEEFGNRIPSLTFEVLGLEEEVALTGLIGDLAEAPSGLQGDFAVTGWSLDGPSRRDALQTIASGYPFALSEAQGALRIEWLESRPETAASIPGNALLSRQGQEGTAFQRQRTALSPAALMLRYYEPARDYQPGLRRSGSSSSGRAEQIDVPAVLSAAQAQYRADQLVRLQRDGLERLTLRTAIFDHALQPGRICTVEGLPGRWRIRRWHWGAEGIDLDLVSQPAAAAAMPASVDPGRSVNTPGDSIGPTMVALFNLPSPLDRPMAHPQIAIAVAGESPGWRGATVYQVEPDGSPGALLDFLRVGATLGQVADPLQPGTALLRDNLNSITVRLVRDDPFALINADDDALSRGANMAMLGSELIQFAKAEPLGDRTFRLSGLWRGRGGTEDRMAGHVAGEYFVLVNDALALVDPDRIGALSHFSVSAQGRGDSAPVLAVLPAHGRATLPLSPVHGWAEQDSAGAIVLRWIRRSRSGFAWRDLIEVPLGEEMEAYRVTLLADGAVAASLETPVPEIVLDTVTLAAARAMATHSLRAAIAQCGTLGLSVPLVLPLPL